MEEGGGSVGGSRKVAEKWVAGGGRSRVLKRH